MTADLGRTFTSSLDERDVTWTRIRIDGFESALREAIVEPVVGAPLPFESLSLAGLPIETEPTPRQLDAARTGVTGAGTGIAALGTLAIQSRPGGDEPVSLYADRHVAVVREADLVPDIATAIEWLDSEFEAGRDSTVLATGASATADMGALIEGVHGPGEVHVVLVEEDAEGTEEDPP